MVGKFGKDKLLKDRKGVLVVGDSRAGKSSFVHKVCHSQILTSPSETIGCNIEMKLHNGTHFVEFWDIGGHSKFEVSRKVFYSQASAIILLFDTTSRRSYLNLRGWIEEMNQSNRSDGKLEESFLHTASATLDALHQASQQSKKSMPRLLSGTYNPNKAGSHPRFGHISSDLVGFDDSDDGSDPFSAMFPASMHNYLVKPRKWIKGVQEFLGLNSQHRRDTHGIIGSSSCSHSDDTSALFQRDNSQDDLHLESIPLHALESSDTDIESGENNVSSLIMDPNMLGGLPVLIVGTKVDLISSQSHAWNLDLAPETFTSSFTSKSSIANSNQSGLTGRRSRATSEAPAPLPIVISALRRKFMTIRDFGYPAAYVSSTKSSNELDVLFDPVNSFLSAVISRSENLKAQQEMKALATRQQVNYGITNSNASVTPTSVASASATSASYAPSHAYPISTQHTANSVLFPGTNQNPIRSMPASLALPSYSNPYLSQGGLQQGAEASSYFRESQRTSGSAHQRAHQHQGLSSASWSEQNVYASIPVVKIPSSSSNDSIDSSHALAELQAESQRFSQNGSLMPSDEPVHAYRPGSLTFASVSQPAVGSESFGRAPAAHSFGGGSTLGNVDDHDNIPTMSLYAFMDSSRQ